MGGNDIHLLTITTLKRDDGTEVPAAEIAERKVCFLSARVHPGETCASWILKGLLDTLMDPSNPEARYVPAHFLNGAAHGHAGTSATTWCSRSSRC